MRRALIAKQPTGNGATPIRPSRMIKVTSPESKVVDSGDPGYLNRILMATPTRGLVRIEWHSAVRGIVVPPNWSAVSMVQRINEYFPTRFSVADAQNLAVREALGRNFEWLLFLEDDVLPPADLYIRLTSYLKNGPPVVSGLYYTKGEPSEPLVYRGRGTGSFLDWKMGEKVWADGVPTGCLLIHVPLLRVMWDDAPEYAVPGSGHITREVFRSPARAWVSPTGDVNVNTGTSDLDWCDRVVEGGYLKKAGWDKVGRRKFPFLVDTAMRCGHIAPDGSLFSGPPVPRSPVEKYGARGEMVRT